MNKEQIKDLIIFHLLDEKMHPECQWVAVDESGSICQYKNTPTISDGGTIWSEDPKGIEDVDDGGADFLYFCKAKLDWKKYGFDWKDSCVKI